MFYSIQAEMMKDNNNEEKHKKEEKEEDGEVDLEELWPRETKPELLYEMKVGDTVIPLNITQDLMGRKWEYAIGNIVWDAAVTMHHYFQTEFPPGYFRGKTILELGSGTGLVGITLAVLGAKVIMTDLPNVLDLLQHNINTCLPPDILEALDGMIPLVEPLTWGEAIPLERQRHYDILIGSDITYNKDVCDALLATIIDLCPTEATEVYIGYLERGDEHGFFTKISNAGFEIQKVYDENVAEDGVAKKLWVHVYHGRMRREVDREEEEEEKKAVEAII